MISVSGLRLKIFDVWKDIPDKGKKIKVYHRRKVYRVTIKPLDEKLPGYQEVKLKKKELKKATCANCGFLEISGVCMNNCQIKT